MTSVSRSQPVPSYDLWARHWKTKQIGKYCFRRDTFCCFCTGMQKQMMWWRIKSMYWRLLNDKIIRHCCGLCILIFNDKARTKQLQNVCILVQSILQRIVEMAPVNILNPGLAISLEMFFSNLKTFILRENDTSRGDSGGEKSESISRGEKWV